MATALSALRIDGFRTSGVRTNGRPGLSQMDLFAGLPERDLSLLDSRLQLVRWPRGAAMPEPLGRPDHLYVVREGRLALFESTAPGHEIMISLLDSGAIYSTLGTAPVANVSAL
jgi:CRP/FNR family transcriptional regulator, cyclic AMP receptor protein